MVFACLRKDWSDMEVINPSWSLRLISDVRNSAFVEHSNSPRSAIKPGRAKRTTAAVMWSLCFPRVFRDRNAVLRYGY